MIRLFYRPRGWPTALKAATLAIIFLCVDGQAADRVARDFGPGVLSLSGRAADEVRGRVVPLIVRGGVMVERSRHSIVGGMIGCAAGAAAGATASIGLGFLSGGVALAGISVAGAIGCGIGGFGGAAIGYPLDAYAWVDIRVDH